MGPQIREILDGKAFVERLTQKEQLGKALSESVQTF